MPKNTKSSASSATRKKKAAKAAKKSGGEGQDGATLAAGNKSQQPKQRGQKKEKGKKGEPRKKVYIPPQKPRADVIDPLDAQGLAALLPSDLVVLLRKASKKDVVTRIRALEGLLLWVKGETDIASDNVVDGKQRASSSDDDDVMDEGSRQAALVVALPCWAFLFPRLAASPNRRLRQLTAQINALLLADQVIFGEFAAQPHLVEQVIGHMLTLAHGPDRLVSRIAKTAWEEHTAWLPSEVDNRPRIALRDYVEALASHIEYLIFHHSLDDGASPREGGSKEATAASATLAASLGTTRDAKNRDDANVEEDLEATDARLCSGALGSMAWAISSSPPHDCKERFAAILTSTTVWSSLLSNAAEGAERSLGVLSPSVRAAGWQLLQSILSAWPEVLEHHAITIGWRALQGAFTETDALVSQSMRDALVGLVRARPEIWRAHELGGEDDSESEEEEDSESDDDDEGDDDAARDRNSEIAGSNGVTSGLRFPMFEAFLAYMRSGLHGVTASYNIVILLLASMPADVLAPTEAIASRVLVSMYAAYDEQGVEGRPAQRAFFSAYLECLVWLSGRVKSQRGLQEAAGVASNMRLPWVDFLDPTIEEKASSERESFQGLDARIEAIGEARLVDEVASSLRKLYNIDAMLAAPVLSLSRQTLSHGIMSRRIPTDVLCAILRKASEPHPNPMPQLSEAIQGMVSDLIGIVANVIASGETNVAGLEVLTLLIKSFPKAHDDNTIRVLRMVFDQIKNEQVDATGGNSTVDDRTAFLIAYTLLVSIESDRRAIWQTLLASLVREGKIDWTSLRAMMRTSDEQLAMLKGCEGSPLDHTIVEQYSENLSLVGRLVNKPTPFITGATAQEILARTASRADSPEELAIFKDWLRADMRHVDVVFETSLASNIPIIFISGILRNDSQAAATWKLLSHHTKAADIAMRTLKDEVMQTTIDVGAVVSAIHSIEAAVALDALIPSSDVMSQLFSSACAVKMPSTLGISESLIAQTSGDESSPTQYDQAGLSVYGRCCYVLVQGLEDGARREPWKLPHLIFAALASHDGEQELGGGSALFRDASAAGDMGERAAGLATSLLSQFASDMPGQWAACLLTLSKEGKNSDAKNPFFSTLCSVFTTIGAERIFAHLLRGLLKYGDGSTDTLQTLLRAAQAAEGSRLGMARAIYIAVKEDASELPLYDRLRNQTAAELAGVKASNASQKGLHLLRVLVDLAPPSESSTPLIPQQRCIFLLQALQGWIASDESAEFPADIYSLMTQLFVHLLPIVQDMAGSHLDFVIDILEMQLGEAELAQDDGVVHLYFALRLFEALEDLQRHSSVLRDAWQVRSAEVHDAVRGLIFKAAQMADQSGATGLSAARDALGATLADAAQALPPKKFQNDTVRLLSLLHARTARPLQLYAFRILSYNIREQVKELVIEAAVRSKEANEVGDEKALLQPRQEAHFPEQLLKSLTHIQDNPLSYVLSWLTAFEFFEESSIDLRAAYTSHLQTSRAVEDHLLPFVFEYMSPTSDPGRWAIDEVFLEEIDSDDDVAVGILGLHVFYRAMIHVPNLVREAFISLKDRQKSMQFRTVITRHLSPLISQREFGHLREQGVIDRLQDENMQIRVAANASEVMATYTIDEHPLEIAISMPNDYPLRPIEVRDIRNVGISEGTWRAWILGIRQLIAGRNGLVFDALLLFKRNVEAKFSGFDEDSTCSICYSIVSPTDHSLPTKPCKTCKKKFHASCLYKWVSTSGSSTCPMCRSIL